MLGHQPNMCGESRFETCIDSPRVCGGVPKDILSMSGQSGDIVQQRHSGGFGSYQAEPNSPDRFSGYWTTRATSRLQVCCPNWNQLGQHTQDCGVAASEKMEQGLILSFLNFMMAWSELSDVESGLPFLDDNEDHDPLPQHSAQVVKRTLSGVSQPCHENLSSELDDVFKCTAVELDIQWPEVQTEVICSNLDWKTLPKAKTKQTNDSCCFSQSCWKNCPSSGAAALLRRSTKWWEGGDVFHVMFFMWCFSCDVFHLWTWKSTVSAKCL